MGSDQLSLLTEWEKEQKKLKAEEEEKAKLEWKMDSQASFARLTITPVELESGGVIYDLDDAIEIKPYPNPIGFGGCWGSGVAKTLKEAKQSEKSFLKNLSTWSIINHKSLYDRGLTNVEVVWKEKTTRAGLLNQKRAELEPADTQQILIA